MGKFPSKPWKIEHFSSFSPIFHSSFLKFGTSTPIKVLFSKLTKIGLSVDKVWSHEIKNCNPRKHMELDAFWLQFFNNWQKNTWWLNGCHGYQTKAILLILTFWRPWKIALITHQLEGLRGLVVCPLTPPPPPPDNDMGSKRIRKS